MMLVLIMMLTSNTRVQGTRTDKIEKEQSAGRRKNKMRTERTATHFITKNILSDIDNEVILMVHVPVQISVLLLLKVLVRLKPAQERYRRQENCRFGTGKCR